MITSHIPTYVVGEVNVKIDADALREMLIALRDRRFMLERESVSHANEVVRTIAGHQLERIRVAGAALAAAVGEKF